jgi:hypothetical protein
MLGLRFPQRKMCLGSPVTLARANETIEDLIQYCRLSERSGHAPVKPP